MTQYTLLKLDYLELISGGDASFQADIFDSFIRHYPQMLTAIEDAFDANNAVQLSHATHKAKSPTKFLGIDSLAAKLDQLEEDIRATGLVPSYTKGLIEEIKVVSITALQEVIKAKAALLKA